MGSPFHLILGSSGHLEGISGLWLLVTWPLGGYSSPFTEHFARGPFGPGNEFPGTSTAISEWTLRTSRGAYFTMASTGTVIQVIGSTFDAQFPESDLPEIYNAVEIELDVRGEKTRLVGEVAKHLGGGMVRCVALGSTDGLRRGQECKDTGSSVTVPVGEEVRVVVAPRGGREDPEEARRGAPVTIVPVEFVPGL